MTLSDHEDLRGQAAAYVLGGLPAEERAEFDAHLRVCDECTADVRALEGVAALLGSSVAPALPSAAVRQRLMARVAPDPRTHSKPGPAFGPWLLAAAAVVAAVALGAYAAALRGRMGWLEREMRDVTARADAAERQLAELRTSASEVRSVVVVLAASDLVRVDLAGQPVAPRASARAFWSRSQGLVFTANNLPAVPAGRTYQLWIVTAEMPVGAGLLKPGGDGAVHAVFTTRPDLTKPVALALTIEPEGGVPAPTGDKYLVGLVN